MSYIWNIASKGTYVVGVVMAVVVVDVVAVAVLPLPDLADTTGSRHKLEQSICHK